MPRTWVYVLKDENGFSDYGTWFYVGVTRRLISRFKEHSSLRGGSLATKMFPYNELVALYNVGDESMSDVDRRTYEDRITLQLMKLASNPRHVRGGRWTTHGITGTWNEPEELDKTPMPVVCECNLPAKSFISKNGQEFYTCPMKNLTWLTENDDFPLQYGNGCNFFVPEWKASRAREPNRCLTCRRLCGKYANCYEHSLRFQKENMEMNIVVMDSDEDD
jgi:predicted GIY-YIG superfamily endonuclease